MQTSPGGSTFPYPYKGGELHCLKYGNFDAREADLLALMRAEEEFLAASHKSLPVWVDFYGTRLTGSILSEFRAHILRLGRRVTKLAVVGCSFWAEFRLRWAWRRPAARPPFPVQFFVDPEDAKSWLVGEEG